MSVRKRQSPPVSDVESLVQGNRRIEPNFGAMDFADDEQDVLLAPRPSRRPSARPLPETAVQVAAEQQDVLMDAPSPHWRRRQSLGEAPAVTEPRSRVQKRERGYTKASPQGESRAQAKRNFALRKPRWQLNPKWILLLLVVVLLAAGYFAREPLGELLQRPFKSVVVEGEFQLISKKRATQLISEEIDSNFLRLDLLRLKHALMADPWVESVSLTRRWPDTLVVKIGEQKPIARWGKGFLNQRGQIVEVAATDKLAGLPWFEGSANDALEILQQYQDFSQLLRPRGLDVIALKCDNKKSWRLTLKNNVEIALGRNQVMEKIRRFVTVYDTELQPIWDDVKAIDVRYTNGIAVRWVEGSESAKKYLKNGAANLAGLAPAASPSAK